MPEREVRRIVLTPDEETALAQAPKDKRLEVARGMGVLRQARIAAPTRQSRTDELLLPRLVVAVGLGLVVAAGVILAGTLIPEAVQDTAVRIACAIGIGGLVAILFGLVTIWIVGPTSARSTAEWNQSSADDQVEQRAPLE